MVGKPCSVLIGQGEPDVLMRVRIRNVFMERGIVVSSPGGSRLQRHAIQFGWQGIASQQCKKIPKADAEPAGVPTIELSGDLLEWAAGLGS